MDNIKLPQDFFDFHGYLYEEDGKLLLQLNYEEGEDSIEVVTEVKTYADAGNAFADFLKDL